MTTLSKNKRKKLDRKLLRKMPKTGCFVYVLCDRQDGLPVYVGQTRCPLITRLNYHIKEAIGAEACVGNMSPLHLWIIGRLNAGALPVIRMLDDKATWDASKAVWIDRYTRKGIVLLNVKSRVV